MLTVRVCIPFPTYDVKEVEQIIRSALYAEAMDCEMVSTTTLTPPGLEGKPVKVSPLDDDDVYICLCHKGILTMRRGEKIQCQWCGTLYYRDKQTGLVEVVKRGEKARESTEKDEEEKPEKDDYCERHGHHWVRYPYVGAGDRNYLYCSRCNKEKTE